MCGKKCLVYYHTWPVHLTFAHLLNNSSIIYKTFKNVPGCEYFCAEALCCVLLCVAVVGEVVAEGQDVADAAAADVAGAHTVLVAVETGSESTQRDAACGREALGPCTLGATNPAAPSHLIEARERGSKFCAIILFWYIQKSNNNVKFTYTSTCS